MNRPCKSDCTRERVAREIAGPFGAIDDPSRERIDEVLDTLVESGAVIEDDEGRLGTPDLGAPSYIRRAVERRLEKQRGSESVNRGDQS